jgi:rhamnose transport system substrate-binding protein
MSLTIGVMPKSTRNPYFEDCRRGAEEAARDLEFTLLWDGPAQADADRQAQIVARWARDGLPAVAVSVEDQARLGPALRDARSQGVRVLTWDADADPEAREYTVVPATPAAIAHALSFEVGRITGGSGTFAVITSTLSAPNQAAWIAAFEERLPRDNPDLQLIGIRPCYDVEENARQEMLALLETHPQIRAVVGFCAPAVPGAASALKEAGRTDLRLTGVSLPSLCRGLIEDGVVDSVVFWRTRDLGFLAAVSAHALANGELEPGAVSLSAGRLGNVIIRGDEIRLGRCHIVSRGNLDSFD